MRVNWAANRLPERRMDWRSPGRYGQVPHECLPLALRSCGPFVGAACQPDRWRCSERLVVGATGSIEACRVEPGLDLGARESNSGIDLEVVAGIPLYDCILRVASA